MSRLSGWTIGGMTGQLALGLAVVGFVATVISAQVANRGSFASSRLREDVMDRWGAPIEQAAPSVRYVASGSVIRELESLPLARQEVEVNAAMSYRKRGLVYFSGFEMDFSGRYAIRNPESESIDLIFVFPIDMEKNKVLLSDLSFTVGGEPAEVDLTGTGPSADKLVWTGRLPAGEEVQIEIGFHGRGLESFLYHLDPALPVRDFSLVMTISGGDGFDYPPGVMPAASRVADGDRQTLDWAFGSLESGVPVGVILPAEKSHDAIIVTLLRRSWVPFLGLWSALQILALAGERRLRCHETLLVATGYSCFFLLLPYLAAYTSFYFALLVSLALVGGMLFVFVRGVLGPGFDRQLLAILAATLWVPTVAVVLQRHTGLIYTLEIIALVATSMWLSTRKVGRDFFEQLSMPRREAHDVTL